MIDTSKRVIFFDDRCKTKDLMFMREVLHDDGVVCLCKAAFKENGRLRAYILFNKSNGEVLTSNFDFWYAENRE
jgi:hypothetical protein